MGGSGRYVAFGRVWRYSVLAVDGCNGALDWHWIGNMKGASIATAVPIWKAAEGEAVVWDRPGGHRRRVVRGMGVVLVEQPAGLPELNPSERVFEELRRQIEWRQYGDIAAKVAAFEAALKERRATRRRCAAWQAGVGSPTPAKRYLLMSLFLTEVI